MATTNATTAALELLQLGNETSAPINVENLAQRVGAAITFEPFKEDLSGVLVKEKGRTVIGVNSAHPKTRQRFTIAHELGHLRLRHKGELFVDQTVMKRDARASQAIDPQEIEANKFAAELLMPEKLVVETMQRLQDQRNALSPGELIAKLAEEFQVSSQAMEYRLTNLGMFMPQ
jgi:Zn-dependent peptidase ImmA (M78 family)